VEAAELRRRQREIWKLALPIIGAMSSQNVLNLVDAAMVAHVSPAAAAAVGLGGMANFVAFSAITGLSTAVQAMAARRFGEGRAEQAAVPLNGGLLLSLAIGLPLSLLLFMCARGIFAHLDHDPEVVELGTAYLRCRLVGVTAIGINFCFRGYWSAAKHTLNYMLTLFGICVLNILLDWTLIFGHLGAPALGVRGAGIASVTAACCGTLAYCLMGWREARANGFLQRLPRPAELVSLLHLGLPTCAQQFLFSTGFLTLFWIIGKIGTAELAVTNVLVNVTLTAILPGIGFGLASATFCGQALGRGDVADAARWPWDVFRTAWWVFAAMALPMLLVPEFVLQIIFGDKPGVAALAELGSQPLRLIGLGVTLDGLGFILMQSLLGVGASGRVMLVTIGLQWGVFLPLAYLMSAMLGAALLSIWALMIAYRSVQTLVLMSIWRRRGWAVIRV
jgi:MATE family, multidrug efflux pump